MSSCRPASCRGTRRGSHRRRPGLVEIRLGGLTPDEVGVRRIGQAAGDCLIEPLSHPEEALSGPFSGAEALVTRVDIGCEQIRTVGIGAGDRHQRHTKHIAGKPSGGQRSDVLAGRNQDLATHVSALLLGRELVLEVDASRAGGDEALGQLEHIEGTTETSLPVCNYGGICAGVVIALRPGDLVRTTERVVDALDKRGCRVGRVQRLIGIDLPARLASPATCQPDR